MGYFGYFLQRMRGAGDWPQTQATIQSCRWTENPGRYRSDSLDAGVAGFYEVTFSYCIEGEYYSGYFNQPGAADSEKPWHDGDKLMVGYNPRRPAESYPPVIGEAKAKALPRRIMAGAGIILVFILYLCIRAYLSTVK